MALTGVLARSQPQPVVTPRVLGSTPLALVGGTVVDVTDWGHSARDLQNAVVIVRDGRITEVGARGAVSVPKNALVIDCTGKYLIPGLIDGFAGMNSQDQASANLYMGVTTVVTRSDHMRGLIDFAAHPSPHLYLIDSVGVTDNWSLLAKRPEWTLKLREDAHPAELSPEETLRQLNDTARLGTRVLFLGPDLTAANTQWIIAHAHQLGLATYGEFVSTSYVIGIEAGVDAVPEMNRYGLGVIPNELQQPLVENPIGPAANTAYDYAERLPPNDVHIRGYARFLASHRAALMPAFSQFYLQLPGHRNLWREPAAAILNPARMYRPSNRYSGEAEYPLEYYWMHHLPGMTQRYLQEGERKKAEQSAMRMWRINETIFAAFPHYLAASGASVNGTMAGISLHTELEMLVRLGLSSREALAAATNNYALQFGWNELGQITPGRRADILVVDGDPADNIWNARNITVIVMDGNVVDRDALLRVKR